MRNGTAARVIGTLVTCLVFVTLFPAGAYAAGIQRLSILPYVNTTASSEVLSDPSTLKVGDKFAVWAVVFGATALQGADLQIRFPPSVLEIEQYTRLDPDSGDEVLSDRVVPGVISALKADPGTVNREAGLVSYAAANTEAGDYQSAVLLKIGFVVVGEGLAYVSFKEGSPEFTTEGGQRVTPQRVDEISFMVTSDNDSSGGNGASGNASGDPGGDTDGGSGDSAVPDELVPKSPSGFDDVSSDDWFYDAVMFVFDEGLFKDTSETTFEPNTAMTRGMFVTVLSRFEFGRDEAVPEGVSPFTDLTQDWYKRAVAWAEANGIVNGVSNTEFAPDTPVTREQMAAIMYRYAQYKGLDTTFDEADMGMFTDAEELSNYANDAMKWAVSKGLITGMTSTTLASKESATRAQVATIVMRFSASAE